MKLASLIALATLATSAYAHSIFQELYFNGVDQGHINGIRVPSYDGPITDVTSDDLICNGGINPYQTPISQDILSVAAGSQITAEWHHTLAGADPSDSADPIDPSHKGPLIVYLAQVPSALQTTVTGLGWFKIYEDGLDANNQTWGVDRLIANAGKFTYTLPSCIPAGQYLMRVEIIALHAATSYPGAQFYMECAQLQVTGGGSASPATVPFPGTYQSTDPGITIDIYQTLPSYTIPGPSVFSCGSSGTVVPPITTVTPAPTTVAPTPTTTKVPTTTAAPPTTVTSPPPSTTTTGAVVTQYGQCGGTGYTGATVCASGYTCNELNAYYYQCL